MLKERSAPLGVVHFYIIGVIDESTRKVNPNYGIIGLRSELMLLILFICKAIELFKAAAVFFRWISEFLAHDF